MQELSKLVSYRRVQRTACHKPEHDMNGMLFGVPAVT